MHRDVVLKFIEYQAIVMAPITPHFCEFVWQDLLKKSGTVTRAPWPQVRSQSIL